MAHYSGRLGWVQCPGRYLVVHWPRSLCTPVHVVSCATPHLLIECTPRCLCCRFVQAWLPDPKDLQPAHVADQAPVPFDAEVVPIGIQPDTGLLMGLCQDAAVPNDSSPLVYEPRTVVRRCAYVFPVVSAASPSRPSRVLQTQPCLQAVLQGLLWSGRVMQASELVRTALRDMRPAILRSLEWLVHSALEVCSVDAGEALALLGSDATSAAAASQGSEGRRSRRAGGTPSTAAAPIAMRRGVM